MSYSPPTGNAANFVVTGAAYSPPVGYVADFKPEYFAYVVLPVPVNFSSTGVHGVQGSVYVSTVSVAVGGVAHPAAAGFPEVRLVVGAAGIVRTEGVAYFVPVVSVSTQGAANSTGGTDFSAPVVVSCTGGTLAYGTAAFSFSPAATAVSRSFGGEAGFSPTFSVSARGLQGAVGAAGFTIKPRVSVFGDSYLTAVTSIQVKFTVAATGRRGVSGTVSAGITFAGSATVKHGVAAYAPVLCPVSILATGGFAPRHSGAVAAVVAVSVYADCIDRETDFSQAIFSVSRQERVYANA